MDVTVESDRKMSDATWRAGATAVVRVTLADGEPQRTKQISRRFTVGARAGNCYHEDVGHATATGRDREEALGAAKAAAVKDGKRRGRGVASSTPSCFIRTMALVARCLISFRNLVSSQNTRENTCIVSSSRV